MRDFRYKLIQFMSGRYGMDQLYYGLIAVYVILVIINTFVRSNIISILMWAVLVWMIFRTLSRNIYKRRRENDMFLKIWNPVKAKGTLAIRRIRESKTHRYRSCPHCRAVLRLPKRIGRHVVQCPRCNKDFHVHIRW